MNGIRQQIEKEAGNIAEECADRAKKHCLASTAFDRWHLFLGIPASLLSAVTSVSALSNLAPYFSLNKDIATGVLAIAVAVLTTLITFLNPSEKTNAHNAASSSYDALKTKADIFKEIDLSADYQNLDEPTKEVIKQLKDLASQAAELRKNSPRIPSTTGLFKRFLPRGSQ